MISRVNSCNSKLTSSFVKQFRNYTTKYKRSLLLQDTEKFPEHKLPISERRKTRVYVWGLSETGALGVLTSLKKQTERYTAIVHHPTRLQFAETRHVTDVAAGYGFTAFAVKDSDGETLYGTGINSDCQIGLQQKGSTVQPKSIGLVIYPAPIKLSKKEDETSKDLEIKSMSAGRAHLSVVTKNGTIFTLGNNAYGQCGRAILKDEVYETSGFVNRIDNLVQEDETVESVECGQDHTMFVTSKGRVLTCGWGADGQTGLGHFQATGSIAQALGDIENEKIIKVASKGDCVLALNDRGEVFGWGNTEYGQLVERDTDITQINSPRALKFTSKMGRVTDIAAGGSFCMALNENGNVFTWGYGILGFGPNVEQCSEPTRLLEPLFGRNDFNPDSRVVSISCGLFHMAAINTEGDLFMWGKNRSSCLGLGHKKDQYFPFKSSVNAKVKKVSCGVDHTFALCKPFI